VAYERVTTPYSLWMLQRVRDACLALDAAGRAAVDAAPAGTALAVLAHAARHRVERRAFKLHLTRA
jgi:hypothetical protein